MEHAKVSQFRSDRNLRKRSFHGDGVPFPVIRPIQRATGSGGTRHRDIFHVTRDLRTAGFSPREIIWSECFSTNDDRILACVVVTLVFRENSLVASVGL